MKLQNYFILLSIFVSYTLMDAATFWVHNRTTDAAGKNGAVIKVRVFWNNGESGLIELAPGQASGKIDCGINNIKKVIYEIVQPRSEEARRDGIYCVKRYFVNLDINGWAVDGNLYIQSVGDFSWGFATLNENGTAKPQILMD